MAKTASEPLAVALQKATTHWRNKPQGHVVVPPPPKKEVKLTVAVSRQCGARGSTIARRVGEKLNWSVYDRELIDMLAERANARRELIESIDEGSSSWVTECLEAFFNVRTVNSIVYVHRLNEVLLSLSAKGHAVIIGRGAGFLLPPGTTLHVRLVAPLRARVQYMKKLRGLSLPEAERLVKQTDQDREHTAKAYLRREPDDPSHYDVTINTDRFSDDACANLIVAAVREREAASQEE